MNQKQLKTVINNLYYFYRVFIASQFKENLKAPHIHELANQLMAIYRGRYSRLCVSMPPRHSKSSMVTLAYPLWLIFHNPKLNILIVNNTSGLSEKFGIQLREYVRKYGEYFDVYLSDVKHSSSHLMFCNKNKELYPGSIRLVGAGGSITGQDVDYLIIDDPYKGLAEEFTPSALEKTIDWFNTIIEQRLEPHSKLIILHTRWHSDDLQGYLQENFKDDYHFIKFAAITEDNTPLWGERYSLEELESKKEKLGERLFSSLYQQKPLDDSTDFFDLQKIHWHKPDDEKIGHMVRAWDIASADGNKGTLTGDFTAGIPMYLVDNDKILITDFIYGQFGKYTKNMVKETASNDGVDTEIIIETGVAAAGALLYQEWEEQLEGYFVEQAKPIKSKVDRATPLQNAITDGKVYVDIKDSKLRKKFINEFKRFPMGAHDDIVDATAHAYNYLNENYIGSDESIASIIEI